MLRAAASVLPFVSETDTDLPFARPGVGTSGNARRNTSELA